MNKMNILLIEIVQEFQTIMKFILQTQVKYIIVDKNSSDKDITVNIVTEMDTVSILTQSLMVQNNRVYKEKITFY